MILDHNTTNASSTKKPINRANLEPVAEDKTYEISTARARDFLKAKLNTIPGQESTSLNLITVKISDRFLPFLVLLPKTVLSNSKNKSNDEDNNPLAKYYDSGNGAGKKKKVSIVKPVFELLSRYAFNDVFGDIAEDKSLKARLGLTRTGISDMQVIRKPHIESVTSKGKKNELVAIAIDPILLFSDMLAVNGAKDNSAYDVVVEHITIVDDINAIYRVRRAYKNSGNKGGSNSDYAIIAKRYSSVGRG